MLPIGIPMIAVVSGFPALVAQLHLAHPFKFDLARQTSTTRTLGIPIVNLRLIALPWPMAPLLVILAQVGIHG